MDDNLAPLVGNVILAWGELDQQLYLALGNMQQLLGDEPRQDGRFSERRKLYRRLCVSLSHENTEFTEHVDRLCGQLEKLAKVRGRIAHGLAIREPFGARFADVPSFWARDMAAKAESYFSFERLEQLAADISHATQEIVALSIDAVQLSDAHESRTTPSNLRIHKKRPRQYPSLRSRPFDADGVDR